MNSSVDLTASGQVALNVFGFVLATEWFRFEEGHRVGSGRYDRSWRRRSAGLDFAADLGAVVVGAGSKFTAGVIDTSEAIGFQRLDWLSLAVLTVGTTKYTGLERPSCRPAWSVSLVWMRR